MRSMLGSVLRSKSTSREVCEPLVAFTEYMYSMLSTPVICCSIGVATDCSRVFASAAGQYVWNALPAAVEYGTWGWVHGDHAPDQEARVIAVLEMRRLGVGRRKRA